MRRRGVTAVSLAVAIAGCSSPGHDAGSAVAAVRSTCHAARIMFDGEPMSPGSGQHEKPGFTEIGWQEQGQPTGEGWDALVRHLAAGFVVVNCKSRQVVHG